MNEEWEILDEFGNPTGEILKASDKRAYEPGVYHRAADVWILNSDNKLLIQRRSEKKKKHPNIWAMTGGSSILGETSIQTLVRECKEELAIDIDTKKLKKIAVVKTECVLVDTYILKQDFDISKMIYEQDEVSEVKWATWDEINEYVKSGNFMPDRWETVGKILKKEIE